MGFLKNFSEPFAFALALWPFVSMLLTVPVLALLYHRDNRIRLSSAIVAYGTVLYLLGLLCFTLYPMPADAAAYCAAHHLTPQLNPLQFIGDIRTDGLTAVLQIAFNIVFFLPLGFIMGRIWRWPLPVTAVLSFATSLFLETMQLTGLMGVFPCAYRLFDVDDLLWNTTGALIGPRAPTSHGSRWNRSTGPARSSSWRRSASSRAWCHGCAAAARSAAASRT